jgi:hypothetical protein
MASAVTCTKSRAWLEVPFKTAGRGIPDGSSSLDWFKPDVCPKSENKNWRGGPDVETNDSLAACSNWE